MSQIVLGAFALGLLLFASLTESAYWKDIQVEYLTGAALRDGLSIFTPLTTLSARYFPVVTDNFPHPSPHPPILAVLALPLSLMPFRLLVPLWLAFNVWLLTIVGRWLKLSTAGTIALAAWPPLWYVLLIGQLELSVLVLAMLGWRAARAKRDWSAGGWLGFAAALKLYPALLLLPFLVRRRGRVLLAATAVLALSHVISGAAVGPAGLVKYYREVLWTVSRYYTHVGLNAAPYGALLRLCGGAADVQPLVNAPGVVLPIAAALSGVALLALGTMEPEVGSGALLVSLPAVWYWYPVLALPSIVWMLRSPLWRTALLGVVAASVPLTLVNFLLNSVFRGVPSMAAALGAVQAAGFVILLVVSMVLASKHYANTA